MWFVLRAIFWLAVVSAFMPTRAAETTGPLLSISANDVAKAATDYCNRNNCAEQALTAASSIRIPPSVFAAVLAQPGPAANTDAVPMPTRRPAP
ncbi:hypothetical protein [Flaviflagellibacter deserti]|uniref:Uncharacterized protein n=1 Tax=Flaviflagellibacter deserti TaxID=2267266 RepID=A0ABV9Z001_9HYPH